MITLILQLFLVSFTIQQKFNFNLNNLSKHEIQNEDFLTLLYKDYSLQYRNGQFNETRFQIFKQNILNIYEHNSNSSVTFKKGISKFTDWTFQEFQNYYMLKSNQNCSATHPTARDLLNKYNITYPPQQWDWRKFGAVSPVKNQGHCGSCWTFSTTGCLESHYFIKYKTMLNLSEQQLVDCAQAFNNHGCEGGLPSQAFEYVTYAGGLTQEDVYPYQARDQSPCGFKLMMSYLSVNNGSVNITAGDENELKDAIYLKGPVSVAFQVVSDFVHYQSGIYQSQNCNNTAADVNHAVLAVGYGVENGTKYWIVKNSWGSDWGDGGFFKIKRDENMCGIAQCNSFPYEVDHPHFLNQIENKFLE